LKKLLRRLGLGRNLGEPVVVVSGLPRSGTSMMMNMLDAAGIEIVSDRVRTADEDNPKGYFEDERVKDLEKSLDRSWILECRGKAIKIISFLLKDLPDSNHYKVVFMRRSLDEVIASQNKMLARRGEPVDDADGGKRMTELYRTHLRKIEARLATKPNFEILDVDYREAIADPATAAGRVARFLDLSVDPAVMAAAVDPDLYRNRSQDLTRDATG
jgi:hypothetical protein